MYLAKQNAYTTLSVQVVDTLKNNSPPRRAAYYSSKSFSRIFLEAGLDLTKNLLEHIDDKTVIFFPSTDKVFSSRNFGD